MTICAKLMVCLVLLTMTAFADPTISVYGALSPNGYGSPSYDAWRANALYALVHGLTSYGDPSLPTYYQQVTSITQNQIQVTSFNSWMGKADPGTVFGPAFANELGNRLLFGLVIMGGGTQFSISQLSFVMDSNDPYDGLDYTFGAGGYQYSADYVGVKKGVDGVLGTGDDVLVTGGSNTELVDALYGRGSGNAYWPCGPGDPTPCSTLAEKQAALDEAAAYNYPNTYTFKGTYTLWPTTGTRSDIRTGSAEVTIQPTPEPAGIILLGSVATALAFGFRRKYRKS